MVKNPSIFWVTRSINTANIVSFSHTSPIISRYPFEVVSIKDKPFRCELVWEPQSPNKRLEAVCQCLGPQAWPMQLLRCTGYHNWPDERQQPTFLGIHWLILWDAYPKSTRSVGGWILQSFTSNHHWMTCLGASATTTASVGIWTGFSWALYHRSWCPRMLHAGCWRWEFNQTSHIIYIKSNHKMYPNDIDFEASSFGRPLAK